MSALRAEAVMSVLQAAVVEVMSALQVPVARITENPVPDPMGPFRCAEWLLAFRGWSIATPGSLSEALQLELWDRCPQPRERRRLLRLLLQLRAGCSRASCASRQRRAAESRGTVPAPSPVP